VRTAKNHAAEGRRSVWDFVMILEVELREERSKRLAGVNLKVGLGSRKAQSRQPVSNPQMNGTKA
jgi:hypothetical protein